ALRLARKCFLERKRAAVYEWLWKAFSHKAKLPKNVLLRLARFNVLRGNMKDAWQLLRHMKSRFGNSYRLYHLVLEIYHREYKLKAAENVSRHVINIAKERGHLVAIDYFSAMLGSFLVKQNRFPEAETILLNLREKYLSKNSSSIKALVEHYLGLSY